MSPVLRLNAPWLTADPARVGELIVSRANDNILTYDDGISLRVQVLDPAVYDAVGELIAGARAADGPGSVVLIVGRVPVDWRAELRRADLSFIDAGGVAEINWPRLRVATGQFAKEVVRRRSAMPLQQGHAVVAEELLIAAVDGGQPTVTELARRAQVSVSTASRTVSQLAGHGIVEREQAWRQVAVRVVDLAGLADLLVERTGWPGQDVIGGYAWSRNIWDLAATISRTAAETGIEVAVTGRVGAAFWGVLGMSSPSELRCWVSLKEGPLAAIASRLGLEPVPRESANVRISADPWQIGVRHRTEVHLDEWAATVAHPLRVWCDLHSEERGPEFAAQLWGKARHAR
jgi:hypothetical protein